MCPGPKCHPESRIRSPPWLVKTYCTPVYFPSPSKYHSLGPNLASNTLSYQSRRKAALPRPANTCFDPDVWAPDFAHGVLCSTEVNIVVDKAVEGRWREGVKLKSPIGMDVADVWDIIDVIPSSKVPAKGGTGRSCCWTRDDHSHRAGKGHLLNGVVHKIEAGTHIFSMRCGGKQKVNAVPKEQDHLSLPSPCLPSLFLLAQHSPWADSKEKRSKLGKVQKRAAQMTWRLVEIRCFC